MKTFAWIIAWMACGLIFGGVLGGVIGYVIANVASKGSFNEMLGVAAVSGAFFGVLVGVPIFGGIGIWRGRRNRK